MTDEKDEWDVPVILVNPGSRSLPDPPPRLPPLSSSQIERFEDHCRLCFHRSWDVFESGAPMWSTCKHEDHQYGMGGERYVECARVAEQYRGEKCPKFWPVLLRMPWRLAWRGVVRFMRRRYD